MTKKRRTSEELRADLKKRDEFNAETGAAVLSRIEAEGKSSQNASKKVQVGDKLRLLYNPLYCEHVMERGKAGWSLNMIAIELNIHPTTMYKWSVDYPEFKAAYDFAKKARLARFEHNYLGISSGEIRGSASVTAAYCGKHDPEEYGDPNKVVVDIKGDGLDAIINAMSASPFSLAAASPPIDVEFEHVD